MRDVLVYTVAGLTYLIVGFLLAVLEHRKYGQNYMPLGVWVFLWPVAVLVVVWYWVVDLFAWIVEGRR